MKKHITQSFTLALTLLILSWGCSSKESSENEEIRPGITITFMDSTARPQDDFYRFVNGAWLDKEEIPADQGYWGVGPILSEAAEQDLLAMIDEAIQKDLYEKGTDQYKAIALFETMIDTVSRNELGYSPLNTYLRKVDKITTHQDLQELMRDHNEIFSFLFFGYFVSPDRKDSDRNALYLGTGTVGLPERDYYLKSDPESEEIRKKYLAHISKSFQLIGTNREESDNLSKQVLTIETALMQNVLPKEQRRDARITYNPMAVADLYELAPAIDWVSYLSNTGFTRKDSLIVTQPKYIQGVDSLFSAAPVDDFKPYVKWSLLNSFSGRLTSEMDQLSWNFYEKELNGAEEQRPLKERALLMLNNNMGEALGKVYVEKKFPPEAKEKAQRMVDNILEAFQYRIEKLDWMTDSTKQKALQKLNKITVKIGYPDKWLDFSDAEITSKEDGGTYFQNRINHLNWVFYQSLEDLKRPVDKSRWFMPPQEVNAYYFPPNNEIVFPAAILQPPFFNYQADMAVNYGGIGAIIGHEISHGFDDSGARFDADGNLNNWWSEEDLKKFTNKGKKLVDQYSKLEPLPGVFVNGEFTLGENIGDLGGTNVAYDALQLDLAKNGNPGLIDGFTPEQRFFIAWAAGWKQLLRDEFLKRIINTDPHSPAMYRAVMPIRNMQQFHEAFDIMPTDSMYLAPEERVMIW